MPNISPTGNINDNPPPIEKETPKTPPNVIKTDTLAAKAQIKEPGESSPVIPLKTPLVPTSKAPDASEVVEIAKKQFFEKPFDELLKIISDPKFKDNQNKKIISDAAKEGFQRLSEQEKVKALISILDRIIARVTASQIFSTIEILGPTKDIIAKVANEESYFSVGFAGLLAENPKYARALLNNPAYGIKEADFNKFGWIFRSHLGRIVTADKDDDFAASIQCLLRNKCIDVKFFVPDVLVNLIQSDRISSVLVLIKEGKDYCDQNTEQILKEALHWDNVSCFKKILESWENNPVLIEKCLYTAVELPAPKCLSYLISSFGISKTQKQKCLAQACERGQGEAVFALCNRHLETTAREYFSEIATMIESSSLKELNEKLQLRITKLLRFTPLEVADKIIQSFIQQHPEKQKILSEIYEKTKSDFLQIAPFIARYTKLKDFHAQQIDYAAGNKNVEKELKYARFCRDEVEQLVKKIEADKNWRPTKDDFKALEPSKKGTQRVAALLEVISEKHAAKQFERTGRHFHNLEELRTQGFTTPVGRTYKFGAPLINTVSQLSTATDKKNGFGEYTLSYRGMAMCIVNTIMSRNGSALVQEWNHGLARLNDVWPSIEDLFEDIMSLDLRTPQENTPKASKDYENRLDAFYSKAAELVWLIGNTQPMKRGSGTVAEWLLAIVHLKHGLEPPLLKPDFPQLDVLDISFPLSDYKRFFTYFFEPSTLPSHIMWPNLSSKPVSAQLETLYALK